MDVIELIHDLAWADLPPAVREQARRCLLDTLGVAATGRQTETATIVYDFAAAAYGGEDTQLWFDGRPVSAPGAALAHGMMIDAFDMHDTCRPVKGHAGVALVPAALATLALGDRPVSGTELLTTLVVGYEVAIRAGLALHATACDYHTSGAWNALGCAAIVARRLGLDRAQTRHALGIAEYHGPRSQMMRCIDHPTMVKDGSGWGAMAGVSAGLLAAAGFTGAPALTVEDAAIKNIWADTGREWHILVQFFKPYPVCYWAQAPIAGAVQLQKAHGLAPADIAAIRVYTFHEATRLATRRPETTDEAQYSLPFPVAAALVHDRVGLEALRDAGLQDPAVLALVDKVEMVEEQTFNDRFPAERLARVEIETASGRVLDSGEVRPLWDLSAPPADAELHEKFHQLVAPTLPAGRAAALEHAAWHCADLPDATALLALLAPPS
jgi:2-methylcitrate dehydratase PrpD